MAPVTARGTVQGRESNPVLHPKVSAEDTI